MDPIGQRPGPLLQASRWTQPGGSHTAARCVARGFSPSPGAPPRRPASGDDLTWAIRPGRQEFVLAVRSSPGLRRSEAGRRRLGLGGRRRRRSLVPMATARSSGRLWGGAGAKAIGPSAARNP